MLKRWNWASAHKITLFVLVLLVALRLALPYIVLHYLNKTLADLGEYTGHAEDVNIALLRGAYQIEELQIEKIAGKKKQPFLNVPLMDLSVEWKSLFEGAIVGEVEVYQPELNFSFSEDESQRQTGEEVDWTKIVKDLLPININRFVVRDGDISLVSLFDASKDAIELKALDVDILNIRNVEDRADPLPSPVTARGDVPGYGGTLKFDSRFNLIRQMPDFDYNMKFENLQLPKLNSFVKPVTGVDFERGTVSLYSEMAMRDGKFNGYFKPLTNGMRIFDWKEKDGRTIGQFFKELFSEGAAELLENQKLDQIATRVPIGGTAKDVKTDAWTVIINVLWNAYVGAFQKNVDNNVAFKDAKADFGEVIDKAREVRKEERDERREKRRKERKKD
ncbi:MAG: DUF748 domain-containing protein [Cytophagaceae bacterium]|nr:DUF748 domain-containing protein [Cytophagaceae bacterium]